MTPGRSARTRRPEGVSLLALLGSRAGRDADPAAAFAAMPLRHDPGNCVHWLWLDRSLRRSAARQAGGNV